MIDYHEKDNNKEDNRVGLNYFPKGSLCWICSWWRRTRVKKIAWDEITKHAKSEEHLHLSVLEAQEKLKDFIGDKICIDNSGCDNHCLCGWNDNLFGIDKMDQFDFGQTVNFGHQNVKSIFGPIMGTLYNQETQLIQRKSSILSLLISTLLSPTISLFSMEGLGHNPYEVHSVLCFHSICVASNQNYSDIVLDIQQLINLFLAIRAAYNHNNNNNDDDYNNRNCLWRWWCFY